MFSANRTVGTVPPHDGYRFVNPTILGWLALPAVFTANTTKSLQLGVPTVKAYLAGYIATAVPPVPSDSLQSVMRPPFLFGEKAGTPQPALVAVGGLANRAGTLAASRPALGALPH